MLFFQKPLPQEIRQNSPPFSLAEFCVIMSTDRLWTTLWILLIFSFILPLFSAIPLYRNGFLLVEKFVENVHNFSEKVFGFVFMVTGSHYGARKKMPDFAPASWFSRLFEGFLLQDSPPQLSFLKAL